MTRQSHQIHWLSKRLKPVALLLSVLVLLLSIPPATLAENSPAIELTQKERAWLKAPPDIRLGFNGNFEPTLIVDPDGSFRGTLVDIIDRLNLRLGANIALQIDPIPITFEKAQTKETDGIALILPQYADKLGFLKTHSFYRSFPTIFGSVETSFEHPDDFIGKRVAIIDKPLFSKIIIQPYQDRVTVKDNGIVFNPEQVKRNVSNEGGLGLFSIEERMTDLGGTMVINSRVHHGTTIILTVSCNDSIKETT